MTPQQLKNSILKLAIEGRLVEQRVEDGTARELLEEIRMEKERLIKEKKIKMFKPLPPITEEEKPFDIPKGWEWGRFNEVFEIQTALVPPHDYGHYPQIAPDIIEKGTGKIIGYRTVAENKTVSNNQHFYVGQILYSKIRPALRKAVIAPYEGLCSADMYPLHSYINAEFALYIILSDLFTEQAVQKANRVKMPKINQEELSQILIPIPPLAEQCRIVAKLEEIFPLIDKYAKAYTKLTDFNTRFPEAMKKSLLQYAIQGKLVEQRAEEGTAQDLIKDIQAEKKRLIAEKKIKKPKALPPITEEEIPFDIPEGWEWVRLGDICTYDQTKEKISKEEILPDMWSLDMEDIEKGSGKIINVEKAGNRKIAGDKVVFHKGDILYSKLRPYLQKILIAPADGICTSELVPFQCYGEISSSYITWLLRSPYVNQIVNTASYGVKMPRVGKNTMVNLLVPLPPLLEQCRIVDKIEGLIPFCDDLIK